MYVGLRSQFNKRSNNDPIRGDTVPVHGDKIVPQLVMPGDRVAVVAPGSQLSPLQLESAVELLRSWKLVVVIGKSVIRESGYLSGPDYLRLQDLHGAWSDPSTTAIFCLRGGYGTQRIVDLIDWTVCQRYPKYLVGFSDITALHLALWKNTRTVTCRRLLKEPSWVATYRFWRLQ